MKPQRSSGSLPAIGDAVWEARAFRRPAQRRAKRQPQSDQPVDVPAVDAPAMGASSSSRSDAAAAPIEDIPKAKRRRISTLKQPKREAVAREAMDVVEGMDIVEDTHGAPGEAGYYRRFVIKCPMLTCGHPGCEKKRGTGTQQTKAFGEMEPLGYLGAWARRASAFESRSSHVAYNPTRDDVETYMKERGWIAQ